MSWIKVTFPEPDPPSSQLEAPEKESQATAERWGRSISDPHSTSVFFRHSGWSNDRRRVYESFIRTNQTFARHESFASCGQFAYVLRNVDNPEELRIAGSCCHDRFCLPCATERSHVIAHNVEDIIGNREIRFLTLTIKTDEEPLEDSLNKLYRSFQALRRRAIWLRNVTGGVAFLELKYSTQSRRWHPHFHCLIEGRWIDQKKLSQTWHEITTDSFVVDIRRPASNEAVLRYVTKYASKPFNTTFTRAPILLDEAIVAMKGRKLAITFGRWRGQLLTVTPIEGAWERVGTLDDVLHAAANGCDDARAIMAALTDRDLTNVYSRAPPSQVQHHTPEPDRSQLSWFGTWSGDGTYRYPQD